MKYFPYFFFSINLRHASSTDLQDAFGLTAFSPAACDCRTISYTFFASADIEPRPNVLVASETYPLYLKVRSTTTMSPLLNFLSVTCACGNEPFGPPAIINGFRVDLYPVENIPLSIAYCINMD